LIEFVTNQKDQVMTDDTGIKVTLKVEGMTCGHCVGRVQKALDAAPGVINATVDLALGTAEISHGAETDPVKLAGIVSEAGYPAQAI